MSKFVQNILILPLEHKLINIYLFSLVLKARKNNKHNKRWNTLKILDLKMKNLLKINYLDQLMLLNILFPMINILQIKK